jgi:hypothetical protein
MKSERRRYCIMVSVIGAGLVLIALDAPPTLLIVGTVMVGLLTMMLTGSLRISREEPAGKETSATAGKQAAHTAMESKKSEKKPEPSVAKGGRGVKNRSLRAFFSYVSGLWRREPSPPDPAEKVKKIDQILDTLMAESPSTAPSASAKATPAPAEAASGLGLAPLRELSTAQLEDDLLMPVLGEEMADPQEESIAGLDLGPSSAISLDLDEGSDEVENILKTHEGDQTALDNLEELDFSMDSLEGINLDGVDLDIAVGTPPAPKGPQPASTATPSPTPAGIPATPDKTPPPALPVEEPMTFSPGSGGRDDFMAALKTDVSQIRKPKDLSLLRELKDEKPEARDLENDLEQLSSRLKVRPSSRDGHTERG